MNRQLQINFHFQSLISGAISLCGARRRSCGVWPLTSGNPGTALPRRPISMDVLKEPSLYLTEKYNSAFTSWVVVYSDPAAPCMRTDNADLAYL